MEKLGISKEEMAHLLVRRMKIQGLLHEGDDWMTVDANELAKWLIESGHVTYETMFDEAAQRGGGE